MTTNATLLYNGRTGGLGRHMEGALQATDLQSHALKARLEDTKGLLEELNALDLPPSSPVTLVQMAALVSVPKCEENPARARKINVTDTLATITAFSRWACEKKLKARVFYVSSGHVYAPKKQGEKIMETDPLAPKSVYAQTKLEAEEAIRDFGIKNSDPEIFIGRVFGLIGIDQPENYVLPGLIRRVENQDFSNIAGLDYVRDYLDTRDVCRHIVNLCLLDWKKARLAEDNIINICSGKPVSIQDLLVSIMREKGLKHEDIRSKITKAPGRPTDNPWILGDPSRLKDVTKKSLQEIPLEKTIQESLLLLAK